MDGLELLLDQVLESGGENASYHGQLALVLNGLPEQGGHSGLGLLDGQDAGLDLHRRPGGVTDANLAIL